MCGIWADWPAITPKPFLKSQTIKFVSHLVPPGGRAHHSEAASLLHLHNLRLHRVDAEGGGDPHQEQTGEQKFHFVGRNISLFGQTEFVKTMPVVWCRCNLSIWNKEKPLTIVFLNFDQRKKTRFESLIVRIGQHRRHYTSHYLDHKLRLRGEIFIWKHDFHPKISIESGETVYIITVRNDWQENRIK